MNLKSYLNLYELLQKNKSTREENRAFGLEYVSYKQEPVTQLLIWTKKHIPSLKRPLMSEIFSTYLYGMTLTLTIIALFLGFFQG